MGERIVAEGRARFSARDCRSGAGPATTDGLPLPVLAEPKQPLNLVADVGSGDRNLDCVVRHSACRPDCKAPATWPPARSPVCSGHSSPRRPRSSTPPPG